MKVVLRSFVRKDSIQVIVNDSFYIPSDDSDIELSVDDNIE